MSDIAAARFAHADIDPPKGSVGMDKDAEVGRLLALDLVPSFIIDSGNGLQPLWRLAYAPKDWKPIENINRAIAKKLGADSCHNIDRLLRVPGTINWPDATKRARGRVPVLTRLAHDGGREAIYTPDQLARTFPPIPGADKESKTSGEDIGEVELLTPDDLGLSSLSPLRSVIEHPAGLDRSKDGIRAAGDLLRAGFTKLQVLGILLNPKNKVSAHCMDQADPRRAALRAIQWVEEHKSEGSNDQDNDFGNAPSGNADPVDLWAKFDPPTLPRGILPDVIERFAHNQGSDMGADMAGIAVSALAVCAAAIPDKIQLQVKRHNSGWLESARLWVALVGPPSSMKSPIMATAVRPLRRIDSEMARQYADARARYDRLPKEEKAQAQPPKQTRLLLQDTTIEAAQEVIKDSPDGVLCYQDEMSGWFGSMDKYSGARGSAKDRAFWLEAFNGAPYSVHRIGRGAGFIENLSISLIGGIQPEPIRKLADESMDDGLLQRLLPIILKPAVEGRDEAMSPVVSDYSSLIGRLHNLASPMFGGGPAALRFDEGAQQYRQELERKHLELQSCESIHRKLAAHIGKYNGIFSRLCVVWHCVENEFGGLPPVIPEETARRVGAFLHGFLLPHALAFYTGVLGLSNDHDRLAAVAGYILARKLNCITNRDVQHGDRTMRGLDRQQIEGVFDQLDALGWIDRIPGPRPTSPSRWVVNPVVHSKFAERAAAETKRRARERKVIGELLGGGAA